LPIGLGKLRHIFLFVNVNEDFFLHFYFIGMKMQVVNGIQSSMEALYQLSELGNMQGGKIVRFPSKNQLRIAILVADICGREI
tara:strand:- start:2672 stop:2920 length:249 start_codon:yes stop_codon:yes gene_type:complete